MTDARVKCEGCERLFAGLRRMPNGTLLCPECADGGRPARSQKATNKARRSSSGLAGFFWVLAWLFGTFGVLGMFGSAPLIGAAVAILGAGFGVIASVQQLRADFWSRWLDDKNGLAQDREPM